MKLDLSEADIARHKSLYDGMSEKQQRIYLGTMAQSSGNKHGIVSAIARWFHVSRNRVVRGIREVRAGETYRIGDRNRAPGAGRKSIEVTHRMMMEKSGKAEEYGDLLQVIDNVVQKKAYGDPMTGRKWTRTTAETVAEEVLKLTGMKYCPSSIRKLIRTNGYSLQKNQKFDQVGKKHPLRNEQFEHIEEMKQEFLAAGDPVISIDTKAKEKLGEFINGGREYRKIHDPRRVFDHDFAFRYSEIEKDNPMIPLRMMDERAIVIPYGVYCLNTNQGFVTLGIDSDTSEFAGNAIKNWWEKQGKAAFPNSKRILILSDGGGSNRAKGFLFKIALQQLADDIDLEITTCHYPPGKSKWNAIEHRLWSQVSHSWNAKPLRNLSTVMEFIKSTTTKTGLTVDCLIDYGIYLTESEKRKARAKHEDFEGIDDKAGLQAKVRIEVWGRENTDLQKWNYTIRPHDFCQRWHNYKAPVIKVS